MQKARVNLDKSNVERLTYLTQFKQVIAPYDGVITARHTDLGNLVTAGSTANTSPLFEIAQYDKIRIFADVPQRVSEQLRVGSEVNIIASQYPGQVFEGKVARTSESIDLRARTLRVEADITNPDYKLLPGMYLKVKFNLKKKAYVQIPASALVFQATGPQVALIRRDNTVRFKDVEIGRDNGDTVETASGLSAGDRIALNINNQIEDGAKVTVRDNNNTAANSGRRG
jgi:RND family efflux transporter MFP subunit